MRSVVVVLLLTAGCFGRGFSVGAAEDDKGLPPPQGAFSACSDDFDCTPAAATCCGCPTFATNLSDPKIAVCDDVDCQPSTCAESVEASCNQTTFECELSCKPIQCSLDCPTGFAIETNGCLSCNCATAPAVNGCRDDNECIRTRADCCGCALGGADTAVLATEIQGFDSGLMCPMTPQCPGVNACDATEQPRCVQGQCELLQDLSGNACGRSDLPPCATGQICTVNASDQANLYGVGTCQPI